MKIKLHKVLRERAKAFEVLIDMFCSACTRVDSMLQEPKRRICGNGHIFCESCNQNVNNCIFCGEEIKNFIHIEFNNHIPRIAYSLIPPETNHLENDDLQEIPIENGNKNESSDSDSSLNEIMEELNGYENCCNKAECEKKPIAGCFQVIGHKFEDLSLSVTLDEEDEREILKNFQRPAEESTEKTKCNHPTKINSAKSLCKKSVILSQNQSSVKTSRSVAYCGREDSLIVNKSSANQVLTDSRHSTLSFTSRSECFIDDDQFASTNSNPMSTYQLFKNEKFANESELANFTSLSASRLEASPPDEKKDSKVPSNACRAKFVPVYQCEQKYPAQMEPIEYFERDEHESQMLQNVALNLPRLPITCPCSFCEIVTTPSDFVPHITIDHPYIETVKLVPNKVVNCTFCPSGNINYVRCHQMFLLSGKLSDIGYGTFKNCLPILLLSCKFNMRELFGASTLQNHQYNKKSEEVLCIWLTSVYQFPINYTLNIWKHGRDSFEQNFIKCISTTSSCLNIKESKLDVATSVMSLTPVEYEKVIDDENMIHCQVVFN